jgi:hypothetical protein
MVMTMNKIPTNSMNGKASMSNANLASPGSRSVETQADGGRQPITGRAKKRLWRTVDNTRALKCYFASKPIERGYRERMWNIWNRLGGFDVSQDRLAMQVDCIKRKRWFSDLEMDKIRTESGQDQSTEETTLSTPPAVTIKVIEQPDNVETDYVDVIPPSEVKAVIGDILQRRQNLPSLRSRLPPLRCVERWELMVEIERINNVLPLVKMNTITELNDTIRVCAEIVTEKFRPSHLKKPPPTPWWKKRLQGKLAETWKDLSRIVESEKRDWNDPFRMAMEKKYNTKKKGYKVVIEELRQRVKALAARIKDYSERTRQYKNNRMFVNNQGQFFKRLKTSQTEAGQAPNKEESEVFWKSIWETETVHNSNACWLKEVQKQFRNVEAQTELLITEEMVRKVTVKMPNWKAPGPDGVQGFWLKNFKTLHKRTAALLQKCLDTRELPG